ncbi:unnamed protein product [Hapterophycus canaliculatus]
MVTQWGMSEEIGPFVVNMGMDGMEGEQWGPTMNVRVNIEVERLVNQAYFRAKTILTENKELMEKLAQKLLDQDTVTSEELSLMIAENAIETARSKPSCRSRSLSLTISRGVGPLVSFPRGVRGREACGSVNFLHRMVVA